MLSLLIPLSATCWLAVEAAPKAKSPRSTARSKKVEAEVEAVVNALQLQGLDFDTTSSSSSDDDLRYDLDQTPEGQQRLETVQIRAAQIFRDRALIELERRPFALSRDALQGEVKLLTAGIAEAEAFNAEANARIEELGTQLTGVAQTDAALRAQIQNLQIQVASANRRITFNQRELTSSLPKLEALNNQVRPLDDRLKQLWQEMIECRKQWLEIRQPQQKYAVGEFEALRTVLDDWLRIDGLWHEALCWRALCAYEQAEFQDAWDYVEKAAKIRKDLSFPEFWPNGQALRGLIGRRLPDKRVKAKDWLLAASTAAASPKNKTDWTTYFLIGRAEFETEASGKKAKARFERVLKDNPQALCVKFWLGQLQTTSTDPTVRDVESGLRNLEFLWTNSTKRSWRLSHALVLAYDAGKRTPEADQMWQLTLDLAPPTERERLEKARQTTFEKAKAPPPAKTKPRPNKSRDAD